MADILTFKKGAAMTDETPPPQQPPATKPYADMADEYLMQQLIDTLVEVRARSHSPSFARVSMRDESGRVWAMPGLLALCQRYLTYITLKAGKLK